VLGDRLQDYVFNDAVLNAFGAANTNENLLDNDVLQYIYDNTLRNSKLRTLAVDIHRQVSRSNKEWGYWLVLVDCDDYPFDFLRDLTHALVGGGDIDGGISALLGQLGRISIVEDPCKYHHHGSYDDCPQMKRHSDDLFAINGNAIW
jgi:hypothetical protein